MAKGVVPLLDLSRVRAVVMDLDGIVTDTTAVRAAAWKRTFDSFLSGLAHWPYGRARPFDTVTDQPAFVAGRTRRDAIRTFLYSRGIQLPENIGVDSRGEETTSVASLAAAQERFLLAEIAARGVAAHPSTLALVRVLRCHGVPVGVATASHHRVPLLTASVTTGLFDVIVDGPLATSMRLPRRPHPATLLEAARRLGAAPGRVAVLESTPKGVEAGARGGFGLVVGVDRTHQADEMYRRGAHTVVADPAVIAVRGDWSVNTSHLPESLV